MTPHRDLTEEEWQRIVPLLPELRPRTESRGRPLANTRAVLNGVLWVMYSGATWSAMPRRYPSYQTCHRRFKAWHDEGVLVRLMDELFGADGVALCSTIQTRMRRQVARRERRSCVEPASVRSTPAAPVSLPAAPAPSEPSPGQPCYAAIAPAAPQPYAYPATQYLYGR